MKPLKEAMKSFFQEEESSSICPKHNVHLVIHSIRSKVFGDRTEEYCLLCNKEQIEWENKQLALETEIAKKKRITSDVLYEDSILPDKTLYRTSFDKYIATEPEQINNKKICLEAVERIKNGQSFNIILQGNKGAGKSHLAYSILNSLNESGKTSSLFVAVDEMLRLIRSSFQDKESKYTEHYFVKLLSEVDYLALDDLGAETGAITTDKEASNFVQRILYGVMNARQGKVTITTTNLSSPSLKQIYDEKLISRLVANPKFVLFRETKDKRTSNLPF